MYDKALLSLNILFPLSLKMSTVRLFNRFNKLLLNSSNSVTELTKRVKSEIVLSFNAVSANPNFSFPEGVTSDTFIKYYQLEKHPDQLADGKPGDSLSAATRCVAILQLLDSGEGYRFFSEERSGGAPPSPANPAILVPDKIYTASQQWNSWNQWGKLAISIKVFDSLQTHLLQVLGRIIGGKNTIELKELTRLKVKNVKAVRKLEENSNLFGDWSLAVNTVGEYIVTDEQWRERLPEIADYITVNPTLEDIDRASLILVALSSDNPLSEEFRDQSLEMTVEDMFTAPDDTLFPGYVLYSWDLPPQESSGTQSKDQDAIKKAIQNARNKVINIIVQVFVAIRADKQEPLVNISLQSLKTWNRTPKDVCLVGGESREQLAVFGLGDTFFCYPKSQILESLAMGLTITPGGFRIPDDYVKLMRDRYRDVILEINRNMRNGLYNPEWINNLPLAERKIKQLRYAQILSQEFGVARDALIHHNIDLLTIDNQDEMGNRIAEIVQIHTNEEDIGSKRKVAHRTASLLCTGLTDTSEPLQTIETSIPLRGGEKFSVEKLRNDMAKSITGFARKYFTLQKLIKHLKSLDPLLYIDDETKNILIRVEVIPKKDRSIYTNTDAIQIANNAKIKIEESAGKMFDTASKIEGKEEGATTPLERRIILPDLKDRISASVATKVPELMQFLGYNQEDLREWTEVPEKEKKKFVKEKRRRGFGFGARR